MDEPFVNQQFAEIVREAIEKMRLVKCPAAEHLSGLLLARSRINDAIQTATREIKTLGRSTHD